jgi:hypothetical protein
VTLPDLPPRGDVSDWLENGGTRADLQALVRETAFYTPSSKVSGLPFHTASEFSASESEPVEWIADGFLAAGSMTLVQGKVKFAGKRHSRPT